MLRECLWIPELETERLKLRKLDIKDADDLQAWLWRPELYTYWGRPLGKAPHDAKQMFIDPRPNVKRKPVHDFIWGIEMKENHNVIGIIEVFDVENDRIGMVGYRISPDYWGKGICTEALKCVETFVFTKTTIDRLHAEAIKENIGSNSVLKKSGFVLEGCMRHGKMGMRYGDINIWGMIRSDYESM